MSTSTEGQDAHKQALVEHPALKILLPHLQSYYWKCLKAHRSEGEKPSPLATESYSSFVFDKVCELDNALASLRLTLQFLMDLGSETNADPEAYRYHYENFMLRVIGFIDRAHRLVGAALFMPPKKFESIGGNTFVKKQTKIDHPGIHSALIGVTDVVEKYREPRNELIHSNAYSNRELGLYLAVSTLSIDTGEIDVKELKQEHIMSGVSEVAIAIAELVGALKALLDELASSFVDAQRTFSAMGNEDQ